LAKDLETEFPTVKVEFIEGSGGIFDVSMNEELIFSKTRAGRFPQSAEIISRLKE